MKLTSLHLCLLAVILVCTIVASSGNYLSWENMEGDNKSDGLLAMATLEQAKKVLQGKHISPEARTKLRTAILALPVPPPLPPKNA